MKEEDDDRGEGLSRSDRGEQEWEAGRSTEAPFLECGPVLVCRATTVEGREKGGRFGGRWIRVDFTVFLLFFRDPIEDEDATREVDRVAAPVRPASPFVFSLVGGRLFETTVVLSSLRRRRFG